MALKKEAYENSFEVDENKDYKLKREDIGEIDEEIFTTVTEECENPSAYDKLSYQGSDLKNFDQELEDVKDGVIQGDNNKVGEGIDPKKVEISPNLGLGQASDTSGSTGEDAEVTVEERAEEIKKLQKNHQQRNSAVAKSMCQFLKAIKKIWSKRKKFLPASKIW